MDNLAIQVRVTNACSHGCKQNMAQCSLVVVSALDDVTATAKRAPLDEHLPSGSPKEPLGGRAKCRLGYCSSKTRASFA
jgi:hypothetical protein